MLGRRKPARAASAALAKRRLAALEATFPARPGRESRVREQASGADSAVDEVEAAATEPPIRTRSRIGGRHAADTLGPLRSLALTTQQVTLVALAVAAVVALAAWWVIRAAPHADPVQLAQERILPTSATGSPVGSDAPTSSTDPAAATVPSSAGPLVVVDVAGKVRRPGIVELPAGSRVVDALRAVGGPRRGIDTSALNLARLLVDGEQIVVGLDVLSVPSPVAPTGSTTGAITPVDVNTATIEQLDTLPGIGPVTAQAVLDWRADNGAFTSVDELLEVSGIGEATGACPQRDRGSPGSRLLRDLAQDRRLARLGLGVRRDALNSRLPTGVIGVALSWLASLPGTVRGEAEKGFALLEVAVPSLLICPFGVEEVPMTVIIGMDPHKRSATIEVIDEHAHVLEVGRYGTDRAGYAEMLAAGRRHRERVWAVEGCNGIGRHIAHRLAHDGETVLDVPAKLSAQVRVFATGNGRKTDPVDAHSVSLAALRAPDLVQVDIDPELVVLGMLVDRRDELGRARTQTVNRLHRLLLELLPGGAKQFLSAQQARALVATVRPRDLVGTTRRRLVVELIGELEAIDKKTKTTDRDLKELVVARGSTLMDLHGVGPSGAARLPADVANIDRFVDKNRLASWNGTAPLDASSGDQTRHRLSRAGNRRINRTLHIMAVVQLRNPTEGRRYHDTKKAGEKTSMEAMRALKRRLSNIVYTQTAADQQKRQEAGPGGQRGNDSDSSAAGSQPHTGTSEKPLPGPATTNPRTPLPAAA